MSSAAVDGSADESAANSQHGILSSKVSRALEVRTDTPAMKAALDALAHLSDQNALLMADSRSIRVAIEQDALQQALSLQDKLRTLLTTVTDLRQGVTETASIAQRVRDAAHMNVIQDSGSRSNVDGDTTTGGATSTDSGINAVLRNIGSEASDSPDALATVSNITSMKAKDDALKREQRLAAVVNDSFRQRDLARQRLDAVHAFLEKFDLSEEDSRLLDHYAFEDVERSNVNGMAFLDALQRVHGIRKELGRTFGAFDMLQQESSAAMSSSGMSNGSGNSDSRMGTSSALRMMESLAQKQERAYERLYHWLQKYLQLHVGADNRNEQGVDEDRLDESLAHPFVKRALVILRNVPAFHSHLLELIAGSRRSEQTRRFLLALTSGYDGMPPIEMKAHDSVAYVGDMLAFCFRAFSIEADLARGLLVEDDGDTYGNAPSEEKTSDEQPTEITSEPSLEMTSITAPELLSHSLGGIVRPFKSRILQVVAGLARRPDENGDDDNEDDDTDDGLEEPGTVARSRLSQLYEICGLLLFYSSAIRKAIIRLQGGQDEDRKKEVCDANPMFAGIMDCLSEASGAYEASLRVYGAMLEQLQVLTGDSEASLSHSMVSRLVEVSEASPGFVEDVMCPEQFKPILSLHWACDILVEAALPACKTLDDSVTLKQSISKAAAGNSEVAFKLMESIQDRESELINSLVEKETVDVLDLCGLGPIVTAWNRFQAIRADDNTVVMANFPGLSRDDTESCMKEFYASLYSPPLPSFESTIKDPALRKQARGKIATNICNYYGKLYGGMTDPAVGGYADLSFLGHTPEQVQTLFSV